jgi:hypothetical protein
MGKRSPTGFNGDQLALTVHMHLGLKKGSPGFEPIWVQIHLSGAIILARRPLSHSRLRRSAESRLEQKEDYGRDASNITEGEGNPPSVTEHNPDVTVRSLFSARELIWGFISVRQTIMRFGIYPPLKRNNLPLTFVLVKSVRTAEEENAAVQLEGSPPNL